MVKFTINEKEYKLPEFINIDDYVKIYKLKDLFSDSYYAAKLVSIVTDATVDELLDTDFEQVNYLAAHIINLLPKTTPKFEDKFTLNGVKYGFLPNWKELTYAEFVDIDTIVTRTEDEMLNMMHILAAVMYRPIVSEISEHDFEIEKYDVKTMVKRSELFKEKLDVRYVLGAQLFFSELERRFLVYSQLSSIPKMNLWTKIKTIWKIRRMILGALFKSRSVGSLSQTELLETILANTTISIKKP